MTSCVEFSAASTTIEGVLTACTNLLAKMLTTRDPGIWQFGDTNRHTIEEVVQQDTMSCQPILRQLHGTT